MRIFVCPVSGGGFPNQIGLMSQLLSLDVRPNLVLGSSGGNVAAYVGLAAEWNPSSIPAIVTSLNSGLFAQSWWPRYLAALFPSWAIGILKGSIYAAGTGADVLFRDLFDDPASDFVHIPEKSLQIHSKITRTELWTGTMNRETGKGQLFCNLAQDQAKIQNKPIDPLSSFWTRDCMPLTYLDGNISLIAKVTMASAAIPVLVPEQSFLGARYVDGGTIFASPLTVLQNQIVEVSENRFHIDYFSSFNLQTPASPNYTSLFENGNFAINELIKSLCINDRLAAIEMLRSDSTISLVNTVGFIEGPGSKEILRHIEKLREKSVRTVLELYPSQNQYVNLLTFRPEDLLRRLTETEKEYRFRFWWIRTPDLDISELESALKINSLTS